MTDDKAFDASSVVEQQSAAKSKKIVNRRGDVICVGSLVHLNNRVSLENAWWVEDMGTTFLLLRHLYSDAKEAVLADDVSLFQEVIFCRDVTLSDLVSMPKWQDSLLDKTEVVIKNGSVGWIIRLQDNKSCIYVSENNSGVPGFYWFNNYKCSDAYIWKTFNGVR